MKKFTPRPFYHMDVAEVFEYLQTSESGLTDFEAQGRRDVFGENRLPEKPRRSRWWTLWQQLNNPLVYIILIAAGASVAVGHLADALFILVVILVNTVVSFLQEDKAERALEELQKTVLQKARVVRGGSLREVAATEVVVGDILDVVAGDRVVADGRLVDVEELHSSEASLTGEWSSIKKETGAIGPQASLGDQSNMIFSGTTIVEGRGRVIVTATGSDTELGKVAQMVADAEERRTPLQRKIGELARIVSAGILIAVAILTVGGYLRGESLQEVFITAVALVVSAIPEGLLPAITVVLVFGMRRLARQKALVRKLSASETMGAITAICMDKTGTLTEGRMSVSHVLTGTSELFDHQSSMAREDGVPDVAHLQALTIASIVNDAYVEDRADELHEWVLRGRPTDQALLFAGLQAGVDPDDFRRTHEELSAVQFSSERKYAMRAFTTKNDRVRVMLLGAPEVIMARTAYVDVQGVRISCDSEEGRALQKHVDDLTRKGLRVLACAERVLTRETYERLTDEQRQEQATLVGFIALKDPVRHDVMEAMTETQNAGVRTIVITGDHRYTAESVLAELGYTVTEDMIAVGSDIDTMDDATLEAQLEHKTVFARVSPLHKIRIVEALQNNGHVVAMVGDGINDAPAIKKADVGIAVGNATDITKEVADIVLLDSSFKTIVRAIEQGRVIFDNIRRIFMYLIADDFSELFLFAVAFFVGAPLPLVAVQILWINLIEDTLPNIALTTEHDRYGVMQRPPRNMKDPIFSRPHLFFMLAVFAITGAAATLIFFGVLSYTGDETVARTMAFALIAFDSLCFAYVIRSFYRGVFRWSVFDHRGLNWAVMASLVLLIAGVHLPLLQTFLQTTALSGAQWGLIVGLAAVEVLLLEVGKYVCFMRRAQ